MDPYHSLSIKKLSQKMIIVKGGGKGRALSGFESLTNLPAREIKGAVSKRDGPFLCVGHGVPLQ